MNKSLEFKFGFGDAANDKQLALAAFKRLKLTLNNFELANLLRKLAKHAAWYAANKVKLPIMDACRLQLEGVVKGVAFIELFKPFLIKFT